MADAHKFSVRKSEVMRLGRVKKETAEKGEEIRALWPYAWGTEQGENQMVWLRLLRYSSLSFNQLH